VLEVAWVVGAIVRPALISFALVWPIVLLLWEWRVRRAPTGWLLEIDEHAITEVTGDERRSIERNQTSFVRFRRRRIRCAAWSALRAIGKAGDVLFEIGLRDDHRDAVAAALGRRGWAVDD
jgi:hypothetical protein